MSYNTSHVVAVTSIVAGLVLLMVCDVTSMSCMPCREDVVCDPLPADCQPYTRPCDCCPECKAKFGAACSGSGLTCESGLMCVNKLGLAIPVVKWYHIGFSGVCQEVDKCRLLKQSWYSLT